MANILLIHGAYQGGWIWDPVAEILRAAGHRVEAPSLEGCGERAGALRPGITTESQAEELAAYLGRQDLRGVTMVGTSTGGMVMCRLAELVPNRIGRLVFADALALQDGEALPDIVKRPTAVNTALTSGPSRHDAETRLFAELDPATRAWALERITQHPISPMVDKVVLPRFWSMPWQASVIWCRRSANPPVAHQRRAQQALGASWHELDTGHYPMLSEPKALAAIIAG
ncbi:esterase [Siccirubricoccus deserti]|uniref:Alpha/beta hydrolase n=1 Tax=Siccirubricoccus deserti TaxID=2013562 RepID=A0A9X0R209_9PROT|nr:alpha/beta hydrolase [Siccirubricoccus deserti]MBC4018224.1 alpha/beta hydrolase [Siccirubricoccus deserti]GGC63560.1 esterase [Siccirubricoccus deserti]